MDQQSFRRLALSLPATEEQDHRGHPSFRVRDKIFATLWPTERRAVVKLSLKEQADLVGSRAAAFSLNAWSRQGWTNVHLAHVSVEECRELIEQAWRIVAPKKLVRLREQENEVVQGQTQRLMAPRLVRSRSPASQRRSSGCTK